MLNLLTENLLSQWTRDDRTWMLTAVRMNTAVTKNTVFKKLYYNIYFLNEKFIVI